MRAWTIGAVVLFSAVIGAQVTAPQDAASKPAAAPESPEDKAARQTLDLMCATCHDAALVTAQLRVADDWRDIINQMAQIGATGTDEQFEQVLQYLIRNYGKVDVNRAPAAELAPVLGVMTDVAEAVVKYRAANGPFKTLDDLKRVPGIDAAKLDARRARITF